MAFAAPSADDYPPGPPRRRLPWMIASFALALFGLVAVTPVIGATAGAESAVAIPMSGGEPGIVRAPTRAYGLESAKRVLKLEDGDDAPQHAAAFTLPWPGSGWLVSGSPACRADLTAAERPLRDRPQSPRAPPHLA